MIIYKYCILIFIGGNYIKLKKILFLVCTMFILFNVLIHHDVFAITPAYPYACSRGVSIYYYVEGGNTNKFYEAIGRSVNNWIHTGYGWNPIEMYEKNSNSGTAIDFYSKTNYFMTTQDGVFYGLALHYNSSSTRIDPTQRKLVIFRSLYK